LFFGIYNSNLSQQYRRRSSKSVQHYNSQQKMAGEKKLIFQHYAFLHSFIAFVFCMLCVSSFPYPTSSKLCRMQYSEKEKKLSDLDYCGDFFN
jgi:hypothetical protein